MPVTAKRSGVHRPAKKVLVKVNGAWRHAKEADVKVAGVWREAWPRDPHAARTVKAAAAYDAGTDDVRVTATWLAPITGEPPSRYEVRLVFTHMTGRVSGTPWVKKTSAQFTHLFTNDGKGYQHLSVGWNVRTEVRTFSGSVGTWGYEVPGPITKSPTVDVVSPPVPVMPTSFDVDIANCEMTQTWAHPGGNNLSHFRIETWISGLSITRYNVSKSLRSWSRFPWNADQIGRVTVNTRIQAVGTHGKNSAWVTISGVMPGPVTLSNERYRDGELRCFITNNHDGFAVWVQKLGDPSVFQENRLPGDVTVVATGSASFPRDGVTKRRFLVRPRTSQGWTGRLQFSDWLIKLPNPVYITAIDSNTWVYDHYNVAIRSTGEGWVNHPTAIFQGAQGSGYYLARYGTTRNSLGMAFYGTKVADYFARIGRIGYDIDITAWAILLKRISMASGAPGPVTPMLAIHSALNDTHGMPPYAPLQRRDFAGARIAEGAVAWAALPQWWADLLIDRPGKKAVSRGVAVYSAPDFLGAAKCTINQTLEFGMSGSQVECLQRRLLDLGYAFVGPVTGTFNAQTRDAVMRFQTDNDLSPVTGRVGPRTAQAMGIWAETYVAGEAGSNIANHPLPRYGNASSMFAGFYRQGASSGADGQPLLTLRFFHNA